MPAARDAAGRCLLRSGDEPRHRAGLTGARRPPGRRVRAVRAGLRHPHHHDGRRGGGRGPDCHGGWAAVAFRRRVQLPDAHVLEAFARWRAVVPTARRMVAAHRSRFLDGRRRPAGGPGQGRVRRLPAHAARRARRGVPHGRLRVLSDWGSTVAGPEVESVRIVSGRIRRPRPSGSATSSTGWACRTASTAPTPRGARRSSRHVEGRPEPTPLVRAMDSASASPRPCGRRGRIYGSPADIDVEHGHRRRHRRGRAQRASPRGLRVLGGALGSRPRGRGDRRAGRHLVDDPRLPRLPRGCPGCGCAQRARTRRSASAPVLHGLAGNGARARRARRGAGTRVLCTDGRGRAARAVVVASGVTYRRLRVPGRRGARRARRASTGVP